MLKMICDLLDVPEAMITTWPGCPSDLAGLTLGQYNVGDDFPDAEALWGREYQ